MDVRCQQDAIDNQCCTSSQAKFYIRLKPALIIDYSAITDLVHNSQDVGNTHS